MADGSVSIRTPPEKGYGLTLDCDLSKIQDEAQAALFCSKIASVRALVQVRLPTQTNEPSARLPSRDQESDASFSLSLSLSLDRSRVPFPWNEKGIPLRKILTDLQQGKSVEKKASGLQVKKSKSMYVKPLEDSVVVVFPVHLDDENDATLAVNFLQVS